MEEALARKCSAPSQVNRNDEDLDEVGTAPALTVAYCQRLSVKEYERQRLSYTEMQLTSLLQYLEAHPEEFYKAQRLRKRENSGLLGTIKMMVSSWLGADVKENVDEFKEQLEEVKERMLELQRLNLSPVDRRTKA